jgi:hypothetical protein
MFIFETSNQMRLKTSRLQVEGKVVIQIFGMSMSLTLGGKKLAFGCPLMIEVKLIQSTW